MFNDHLQTLRTNITSLVLLLSATVIGFVWISIGIYHWLSDCLGAVWGPIVLGFMCFVPIILVAFFKAFVRPPLPKSQSYTDQADVTALNIAKVFESLSGRSPFVVTSAAVIAGFLATRFPALLVVFAQILAAYADDAKMRATQQPTSSADQ